MDVLDLLQKEYPEVYDRTQYHIVEISERLVQEQEKRLKKKHPCVKVEHKSIFHWKTREPAPCFFIAMEVIVSFDGTELSRVLFLIL